LPGSRLYCTMSESGWLQSVFAVLATRRVRNRYVAPGCSPVIVVLLCSVARASCHVLPASALNAHSYEQRVPPYAVTRATDPDTVPFLTANARRARTVT